jgi:2-aminoadipate transaminase
MAQTNTNLTNARSAPGRFSRRAACAGGEPIASVLMARTLANPQLISLAAGFVDQDSLPLEAARQAFEAVWSDPSRARAALQYGTTIGYGPLREMLLQRMLEADGCSAAELGASVEQVVVTAGSNQLLFLLGDVLLDPGDIVLCASPSYFVFLGTLKNLGARAVAVATDRHGPIPQAIDELLRHYQTSGQLGRIKAIYVCSYFDNPAGTTVAEPRRAELVELVKRWSRRSKLYLIEDAVYRPLRYYGSDIPSIRSVDSAGDTVIHVDSFSKSFSPGVRVGWGLLPRELLEPVLAEKGNIDFGSPNFNQVLMAAALELGLYQRHVHQLCDTYRQKLDTTLRAVTRYFGETEGVQWLAPEGGLYLWLRLPEHVDTGPDGPLFDRAVAEGVLYVPGECCFPAEPGVRPKNFLRLSFGIPTCEEITRGVEALRRALAQVV